MTSLLLSPASTAPLMPSFVFETPIPVSTLKRRSSDRLSPPLLKRKRDHTYCAPVGLVADTPFNINGSSSKSRLPMLDISDFNQPMPLPGQNDDDDDAVPKTTLRPRTSLLDEEDEIVEREQQQALPRLSFSLVPISTLAKEQQSQDEDKSRAAEKNESELSSEEPVLDGLSTTTIPVANQVTRRSSFPYPTNGAPLLNRSVSLQFSLRRLSIGSCNSLNSISGCTATTPALPSDGQCCQLNRNKSLDKLSIPSLEDVENGRCFLENLGDKNSNNMCNKTPLAVAQPPLPRRGSRNVFDYLATALRLPDVALGV